jgi:BirA family biotin operon repressor/biotin-[acetyl-CoA-carboxylase] ligase
VPNQTAPFDVALVRSQLAGTRFADVRYVAQTGSTNTDAQLLLGQPAALGSTIVADYQSAGAGRKARRWFAPPGSALLFTALLPAPIDAATIWAVPFWIALGVAAGAERSCGVALDLVWPNDLHVGGRKIGGILSVARISGDDAWVGCGVGLNVRRPAGDPDLDALAPPPLFLDDLAAAAEREPLLVAILRAFDASLAELRDPAAVVARWEHRASLAGTIYRYRRDDDGVERDGVAQRIGPHGALILRDTSGERPIEMADVRVIGHTLAGGDAVRLD